MDWPQRAANEGASTRQSPTDQAGWSWLVVVRPHLFRCSLFFLALSFLTTAKTPCRALSGSSLRHRPPPTSRPAPCRFLFSFVPRHRPRPSRDPVPYIYCLGPRRHPLFLFVSFSSLLPFSVLLPPFSVSFRNARLSRSHGDVYLAAVCPQTAPLALDLLLSASCCSPRPPPPKIYSITI